MPKVKRPANRDAGEEPRVGDRFKVKFIDNHYYEGKVFDPPNILRSPSSGRHGEPCFSYD